MQARRRREDGNEDNHDVHLYQRLEEGLGIRGALRTLRMGLTVRFNAIGNALTASYEALRNFNFLPRLQRAPEMNPVTAVNVPGAGRFLHYLSPQEPLPPAAHIIYPFYTDQRLSLRVTAFNGINPFTRTRSVLIGTQTAFFDTQNIPGSNTADRNTPSEAEQAETAANVAEQNRKRENLKLSSTAGILRVYKGDSTEVASANEVLIEKLNQLKISPEAEFHFLSTAEIELLEKDEEKTTIALLKQYKDALTEINEEYDACPISMSSLEELDPCLTLEYKFSEVDEDKHDEVVRFKLKDEDHCKYYDYVSFINHVNTFCSGANKRAFVLNSRVVLDGPTLQLNEDKSELQQISEEKQVELKIYKGFNPKIMARLKEKLKPSLDALRAILKAKQDRFLISSSIVAFAYASMSSEAGPAVSAVSAAPANPDHALSTSPAQSLSCHSKGP